MEIVVETSSLDNQVVSEKKCCNYAIETLGWVGSVLVFIAYVGSLNNTTEFLFNSLGSLGVLTVLVKKRAIQPIILNIAWQIGSLYKFFNT